MGTALERYKEKMAAKADEYASEEKTSSSFISMKGGILKFGEEEFPGNEMLVVVLDAIHENTYYEGKYDPDVSLPPKCFAFGRAENEMQPHENVPDDDPDSHFELQSEWCDECPKYEWGSADTGRGKACSSRRRLAVIPAGVFTPTGKRGKDTEMSVYDKPEHYRKADMAFLKLPVTSTKEWAKYVHDLRKDFQTPPFGVLTHVYLEPDEKTSFKVFFECVEPIEDEDILEILFARNAEARDAIEQPYTEPSEEALSSPKNKAARDIKSMRKGGR